MKRDALLYGIGGIALGMLIAWSIVIWTAGDNTPKDHKDMPMSSMQKELERKSGEEFDKHYLKMMIAHHQAATDMAKLAETHAAHTKVKDLSKRIITEQSAEITTMQQWQKEWGYPVSSTVKMNH